MRRIYSLAALAAAVTLGASAAQAQTKVVIGIPTSPPNVVHMPPIVAKDLGLFKKEGLDVEIVSLGDGTKVYRALLAGNIDFGLTPGATKTRRVRRRAIDMFRVTCERRTRGRTGVLLYLSLLEHRAEIVADKAIAEKTAPEDWGEAMAVLIAEVKAGRPGEGMALAVEKIGAVLARVIPPEADNPNELPDSVVEL